MWYEFVTFPRRAAVIYVYHATAAKCMKIHAMHKYVPTMYIVDK